MDWIVFTSLSSINSNYDFRVFMPTKNHLKRYLSFFIPLLVFCTFYLSRAWGEGKQIQWQRHETKYTVLQYCSINDIKKFDRSIDFSPDQFSVKGLFMAGESNDPMGSIAQKIDALFERVQQILDMRKKLKQVTINIYSDEKQFHEAYYNITWTKCVVRAWYFFENNTIYVNVNDIHEGILAHEMAHAIIDNYLDVRPPRATAEILAVYVDQHLFD